MNSLRCQDHGQDLAQNGYKRVWCDPFVQRVQMLPLVKLSQALLQEQPTEWPEIRLACTILPSFAVGLRLVCLTYYKQIRLT